MPRPRILSCLVAAVLFAAPAVSHAAVKLPAVFSDHMVLQRDQAVPVWGTASPGEKVTVSVNGQTQSTTAGDDGKWSLKLKPLKVGGPLSLTVTGENTIKFEDVLVGDVWIGSGQSNMAGGVAGYAKGDEDLAKLSATAYPNLRLCRGTGGGWVQSTPENNARFSALLFSFGQRLQEELDVPVGLILGAVGGTPSGRWLTAEMLEQNDGAQAQLKEEAAKDSFEKRMAAHEVAMARWKEQVEAAKAEGKNPPRQPLTPVKVGEIYRGRIGDLYQAHIQPVVPYAIRGVLWDQGESGTAIQGLDQFAAMGALISGWRDVWQQGEFPFLYVQKPSGGGCAWDSSNRTTRNAEAFTALPAAVPRDGGGMYRELHIRIMQHPNTAMVTARDLGSGVHPTNKSGYGHRAVRVALGMAYGRDVEYYGPLYQSHSIDGNTVRIKFSHVGQGLTWKHGDKLQGFEVAGEDGNRHWADARIDGDTVVVTSDEVAKPVVVRYAWSNRAPWANLFNKDGLPAVAFSTSGK